MTPLGRVEGLPLRVVDGHVQETEKRRQERLQGFVESEELAGDLLPECAVIIALLELAVNLQEVDDGQVTDALAWDTALAWRTSQPSIRWE